MAAPAVDSYACVKLRASCGLPWFSTSHTCCAPCCAFNPLADFNDIPLDTIVAQTHKTMAGLMRCVPPA